MNTSLTIKINKTNRAYAVQKIDLIRYIFEDKFHERASDISFAEFKKIYEVDNDFIEHIKQTYKKGLCSSTMLWFKYDFIAEQFYNEVLMPLETARKLSI